MKNSKSIQMEEGKLDVPNYPIIPFIEGDGIGSDIWKASVHVFDNAIHKAYGDSRKIDWLEVFAGEKAFDKTGEWLPKETLDLIKKHYIAIKGPLTTPVGGGIRSLNVALRQKLDLYACVRPVRWFQGVPSPVKEPGLVDMIIFRENTEDIYAGIEWMDGTEDLEKVKSFLMHDMGVKNIRFPNSVSLGVKPVSKEGTYRLVRAALDVALKQKRKSVKGDLKIKKSKFFKNLHKLGYRYFSSHQKSYANAKIIKIFQQRYSPNHVTGKLDLKTFKISEFLKH